MMTPNAMICLNQSASTSSSDNQQTRPFIFPFNPQLLFLQNPIQLNGQLFPDVASSNSPFSEQVTPASSPDDLDTSSPAGSIKVGGKVKRGRPQQEIRDDLEDPSSQKRKHRRLYARQYRAQMRQKIDEVKKLQDELGEAKRKHQEEIAHLNQLITNLIQINQHLMPAVFASSTPRFI